MKNYNFSENKLKMLVANNFSISEILRKLGLAETSFYARNKLKSLIKEYNIDTNHFDSHKKSKENLGKTKDSLENQVKSGWINVTNNRNKKALIKLGVFENVCAICGINDWLGKPLSLHLDHIDGDRKNNHLSNLRLICPNCHSQTDTYCGKNVKHTKQNPRWFCIDCKIERKAKQLPKKFGRCFKCNSKYLSDLHAEKHLKAGKPTKDQLKLLTKKYSNVKIGKMYKVSSTTVKKWIVKYDL